VSLDARLIVASNLVLLGAIAPLILGGQGGMCLGATSGQRRRPYHP